MGRLRICLATSELFPFSKAGGLADVSNALGRYLALEGHDIRIFSPLYATINTRKYPVKPVDFLQQVPVSLGPITLRFSACTAPLPDSEIWVYFVHCPELYDRPKIYTTDPDEHRRFLLLSRAVFECCQRMGWSPHVLHCNDWPTALIPLFRATIYGWDRLFQQSKTVLTIHNLGYQGVFSSIIYPEIVPAEHTHRLHQDELRAGVVNFLKTGILYADTLTTVSPTYAREIQNSEQGAGLDGLLQARRDSLVGILNGVDYEHWSPLTDSLIAFNYVPRNAVSGKRKNKEVLLRRLGLPKRDKTPLVGVISRLVSQKGFDLLFGPLPKLLEQRDFQFVVLGNGEPRYEAFFRRLSDNFPQQVSFNQGYNDELAHMIEAGSDLFLMPSRYEPCGLNQMYSLKYGTIPIVRNTGGLADTVQPFDSDTGSGTGFVFDDFSPAELQRTFHLALDTYADRRSWLKLMRNAMAQDFSWKKQIQHYIRFYAKLAGDPD